MEKGARPGKETEHGKHAKGDQRRPPEHGKLEKGDQRRPPTEPHQQREVKAYTLMGAEGQDKVGMATTGAAQSGGLHELPTSTITADGVGKANGVIYERSTGCTIKGDRNRTKTSNSTNFTKSGDAPAVRSILTINVDGLHGVKTLELTSRVHQLSPDVVVVTETEVTKDDLPYIPNYTILVPSVSESKLLRSIMYIRTELQPEQLPTPPDVQVIAARIGKEAILGLYRQFTLITDKNTIRGCAFETQQYEAIETVVRAMSNDYKTLHICGDFNLNPRRLTDEDYYRKGLLQRWCDLALEIGLKWAETGPTFRSHGQFGNEHRLSTIDLVYSRCARVTEASVLPDALSDHSPVFAVIRNAPQVCKPKKETRQDRNWQKMDITALEIHLLNWDWDPLLTSSDVNEAVSLLNEATMAAVNVSVPLRTYTTPNIGVRLSADTRACMRARNRAKREGALHYKTLRNQTLKLVRRDYVKHNMERISRGGQETAWKIASEISGKRKASTLPMPTNCSSDVEAANQCNRFYIDKVSKLRENMQNQPSPKERTTDIPKFKFHCVGTATVRQALKKLKSKPSCGIDSIPITVYKGASEALLLPLVHIINIILTTGVWPTKWKESIVLPTLKSGKPPGQTSSYRPVSILCSVSKLAERVMNDQLVTFLEEHSLIPHQQHGFRANRGVDSMLTCMLAKVAQAQDKNLKIGITAWDYTAAFDTVSTEALELKLWWADELAKKLVKSYMHKRVQKVKWNNAFSDVLELQYGVPQGSVLAPLLFIILTQDLAESVTARLDPSISAGVSQYADDTNGYAASKCWEDTEAALSMMASDLEKYSYENGLHLNVSKTQSLKIGHPETTSTETLNILGVTLDKRASFGAHNSMVLSDLRRRIGAIRQLSIQLPRGKLLTQIASSLIIGRLQASAWVTRSVRLNLPENKHLTSKAQVVLNDLARLLLGIKRTDRYKTVDLTDKSGLPTVNEIVVRQAAVAAWKATNGSALEEVLEMHDSRTRGSSQDMRKPISQRCLPASNMSTVWNSSETLRKATTLSQARSVARHIAKEHRHA